MGKRKTAAKPQKKIKQTLDIAFTCLFCNHENAVICTLDKRNLLGELHCKICGQSFQTAIHSLSHPVDVYSDWIDACEDLAEEAEKGQGGNRGDDDDDEEEEEEEVDDDDDDDDEVGRNRSHRDALNSDDDF